MGSRRSFQVLGAADSSTRSVFHAMPILTRRAAVKYPSGSMYSSAICSVSGETQNVNPSDTIRSAVMDGASAAPPVMPNRAQNCLAKIHISAVAAAPSMTAALTPDLMTLLMS